MSKYYKTGGEQHKKASFPSTCTCTRISIDNTTCIVKQTHVHFVGIKLDRHLTQMTAYENLHRQKYNATNATPRNK